MARTGQQRLDAIPAAIEKREEFYARVESAGDDVARCADLMAEAIEMKIDANMLEVVGSNGKVTVCIESVVASHCMISARGAYLKARGSNRVPNTPSGSD